MPFPKRRGSGPQGEPSLLRVFLFPLYIVEWRGFRNLVIRIPDLEGRVGIESYGSSSADGPFTLSFSHWPPTDRILSPIVSLPGKDLPRKRSRSRQPLRKEIRQPQKPPSPRPWPSRWRRWGRPKNASRKWKNSSRQGHPL